MAVFSPVGGRLSDRIGRRIPSFAGIALLTFGVLPLTFLNDIINVSLLLACLWLMGIGLGLSSASVQTSILESVKLHQAGLATGISSTSRYVGSIIGSNILAQIIGSAPIELTNFRNVFITVTISACIALMMSWGIRDEGKKFSLQEAGIRNVL
jgi:MFS family permease